jgi:hypothetical protein
LITVSAIGQKTPDKKSAGQKNKGWHFSFSYVFRQPLLSYWNDDQRLS